MDLISTLLPFLPFIVIIWLANFADGASKREEPQPIFAVLTYVLLIVVYGLLFLFGVLVQVSSLLIRQVDMSAAFQQFGMDAQVSPDIVRSLPTIGLGLWLPSLLAMILLLPPVRRAIARLLPIDPASTVHAVALSYIMLIVTNLMLTLGVGLENLTELLSATEQGGGVGMGAVWIQELILAFWAMIGVGWLSRRSIRQVAIRLGMRMPSGREMLIGFAAGLAMIPVVIAIEALSTALGIGPGQDVQDLTEQLIGPLFNSIAGVLTLGLAAAIGEETIFRGALQPRFGLILTSLLFALTHSNYGITVATLVVFLLGLVLGVVRNRYGTSVSMITHATYNSTLGLIAYLGVQFLQNQ